MSIIPPLYLCPDCEPGTIMYAGKVIFKRCSSCEHAQRNTLTGADRQRALRQAGSLTSPLGVDPGGVFRRLLG